MRLKRALGHSYDQRSIAANARGRRWQMLLQRFPDVAEMRVLDLGGMPAAWDSAGIRPKSLKSVNLRHQPGADREWFTVVEGDACDLPESLKREHFDLVYCNSVIEHVGGHYRREQLAATVHAAADHHWVQVPYRYFPIEPHWMMPGFQFLPAAVRTNLSQRDWTYHKYHPANSPQGDALAIELLTITEMRYYFPRSTILREKLGGLVKSLIATA